MKPAAAPIVDRPFYGPTVVRTAFLIAVFGWGIGFYGPPIFLHQVIERTGWPIAWVSTAVTTHFLSGALIVALLPFFYRRLGIAATTCVGAIALAIGAIGWAAVDQPWQLFGAALLTGGGWVTLGGAAINAIVSPWYEQGRPRALSSAYNGASVSGIVFSPLWVAAIGAFGFLMATTLIASISVAVVTYLAWRVLSMSPQQLGQYPDGQKRRDSAAPPPVEYSTVIEAIGLPLWRNRQFVTLALAMTLGLFAQVGLITHLYTLFVPDFGIQQAGWLMAMMAVCAVIGRSLASGQISLGRDRRVVAAANTGVQLIGAIVLLNVSPGQIGWIVVGALLIGAGVGNTTSLPPMIAQAEFDRSSQQRVVSLIIAIAQSFYAFAPAAFSLVLVHSERNALQLGHGTSSLFITASLVQLATITALMLGRRAR